MQNCPPMEAAPGKARRPVTENSKGSSEAWRDAAWNQDPSIKSRSPFVFRRQQIQRRHESLVLLVQALDRLGKYDAVFFVSVLHKFYFLS